MKKNRVIHVIIIMIILGSLVCFAAEERTKVELWAVGKELANNMPNMKENREIKKVMTREEKEIEEFQSGEELINLPQMEWALFLATEVSYGASGDYYRRYGIYGDFTKERTEGEKLGFSLYEKTVNDVSALSLEIARQEEDREKHMAWLNCTDEVIVDCLPDLSWIATRENTTVGGYTYIERWYQNGEKIKEFRGIEGIDLKRFIWKREEARYDLLDEEIINRMEEYIKQLYEIEYYSENDKWISCFDSTGRIFAAVNQYRYDKQADGIHIYALKNAEIALLHELKIPISAAKWPLLVYQVEGNEQNGWVVFSYGYETFRITYPEGKTEKLGEYMFSASYSPDGKYLAYCTGNMDLFYHWENLTEEEYELYYRPMKEEWDTIPQGWYIIDVETKEKYYIPVLHWEWDTDRPLYGGRCTWIEKDKLMELLEME